MTELGIPGITLGLSREDELFTLPDRYAYE